MTPRLARLVVLLPLSVLLAIAACVAPPARDATTAPDALLPVGPFAVGFQSSWAFDDGRTYRTAFDDGQTYGAEKSPRPVLVLMWYPARTSAGEPMPHAGYFDIACDDPRLASFSQALASYARGVFVEQVMGVKEAELDAAGRAELATALAAPTLCRRAAARAKGQFPLVVYHCGAGSSFEDNAALCEFLASHGYVVLCSAYPRADGSSLGIDAGRGSAEDVQFLVRRARALAFVDWRHVGLIGHSAGAQAMARYAAQPGSIGDALVMLDTTQDYYALGMPMHKALVSETTEGVAQLTRPMLVAAGPEAIFALCDTLVNAERTYLTVPELDHDEFISQGHQRLARIVRHEAASPGGPDAAAVKHAQPARANYRVLCDDVRAFFDAELGRGDADFAARLANARAQPWSPTVPCLVPVPKGVREPEAYDLASAVPPSPREFRRLFEEQGVEAACEVLVRFHDAEPRSPLYVSEMVSGSLLYVLLENGRRDDAALYYDTLKSVALPVLSLFTFLADINRMQHDLTLARHILELAHGLDPDDAGVAAKLRELEGSQTPE
jgi:hypothetical protein